MDLTQDFFNLTSGGVYECNFQIIMVCPNHWNKCYNSTNYCIDYITNHVQTKDKKT